MESELDTQSSISSIDIDPKGKYLIAGGREILKLIDLDVGANVSSRKMNIKLNLRRQGTKLAIGYVEFNKKKENYLLAASVQGNFQIWDIEKPKEIFNRRDHSQAIHRMNWQNEHCFISGGQDYQIYYYDIRNIEKPQVHNLSRSDAIRDIKFNISEPNYFMAASDSGLLEYFDIRNVSNSVSEAKCWKQNSSTNLIICLDWGQNNIFASGSNDKEIKIWQVDNHTEIREKAIIQHIDGSSHIRWHKQNPSYLSVSSLNRDISVTTYDIRTPYRPIHILKGHNDIITSFVFNHDETQIITGSKDKYLRMQPVANAFEVYKNCPIFPVAFNQYNDLIMKLESPNFVFTEFDKFYQNTSQSMNSQNIFKQSSHEDSIFKAKTSNFPFVSSGNEIQKALTGPALVSQSKLGSRALFYIEAIDQKFDEKKPPFDLEIDYLQNHYNSKRDFQYNSSVAQDFNKPEIAHYWKALDHLINDLYGLGKEFVNPGVLVCPISTPKQIDQSDDDQKSPLETPIQTIKNKLQDRRQTNQLDWQDIQKLYKYFEKYPAAFKQELESKNIIIEDQNHLKIHIERIPYYKTLLRAMTPMGSLLTDKKQMMKVISNSILQLIQYVIDLGELPSGFWMAACAKNFVSFPEAIATKWTQSYIDLLVSFGKQSFAMKVALESPVEKFRNSNKYKTDYKCLGGCKQANAQEKQDEDKNQPFCQGCKTDFICSLCFQPVRGLYLWCQICMHGGHMKEMKQWFNKNTQCPLGCGHNCFEK